MEKFLKYTFATIFFVLAFTPPLLALVDTFLWFLFNFTLLSWYNARVTFAVCWTLTACPIFSRLFCELWIHETHTNPPPATSFRRFS